MTHRLVDRVLWLAVGGTASALLLVGAATAAVLDYRAKAATDAELIAAGTAFAHAPDASRWVPEHDPSPVLVGHVGDRAWGAPPDLVRQVRRTEALALIDVGDRRMLLMPTEAPDAHEQGDHAHAVVVATLRRVHFQDVAGPFLAAFVVVAAVLASGVALAQMAAIRRELAPLRRASGRLRDVAAAASGVRLDTDGPEEISAILREINALLDRLDAAFGAQARFTADAAHELRTPIAAIVGEIELALLRPRTVDEHVQALRRLDDASRRLAALVEALMALARVDAGQAAMGRSTERMSAIVLRALREVGGAPNLDLTGDALVEAHVPLMQAAVSNLLRNAKVHGGGADHIALTCADGVVTVSVGDRGPGVAGDVEALFQRFARREQDGDGGLGLGLPLVREVARRHGGDCVIEPRPGGGTLARLTIPCQIERAAP